MRGEAMFGGVLAIMVVLLAGFAVWSFERDRIGDFRPGYNTGQSDRPYLTSIADDEAIIPGQGLTDASYICQCFDDAKVVSSEGVDAEPARYRTGLIQCRSIGGEDAAQAWTAGWNAALSSAPWERTCLRYKATEGLR